MKHRRLVLMALLLACVAAVMVPFRREIWRTVAYEEKARTDGLVYFQKRPAWLPGDDWWFPDQVCPSCIEAGDGTHARCELYEVGFDEGEPGYVDPPRFSCTCTDYSHTWVCPDCTAKKHTTCDNVMPVWSRCKCPDPSHGCRWCQIGNHGACARVAEYCSCPNLSHQWDR